MMDGRKLVRVLWCMVATSAVILTGDIPWWLSLAMLALVPVLGLANSSSKWLPVARRVSSIAAGLYLFFFPLDWFYLSGRLIFATVHLMFYLKLHTLLHQESARERSRLHLICLFELLAAASMTVAARFVLPLALFVLLGTLVLVLEQSRPLELDRRLWRPALRASLTVALPALMIAGLVFVSLPRTTHGGFRLGGVTGITVTGFSEEVRLGDFGEITRNTDVVMRIVAEERFSPPRWRGPAYDLYEHGEWRQALTGVSSLPRSEGGAFLLDRPSEDPQVESEVFLEPLDTDVLFLPPASSSVETTERYVFVDPYLTLRTGRSRRAGRRYAVRWRPGAFPGTSPVGGVERMPVGRRRLYTHVPELSPRFHALAEEVVPDTENVLEAARLTASHLRTAYDYSLQQPGPGAGDPLEVFLFDARAGHCEYFATAMIMMLRSQGIPSRLVTGFTRGQPNALGDFEVVRKTNAHAWVEVFDERRGWVAFDPTPPSPDDIEVLTTGFITQSIDSLRMLWDMYVVAFDSERQRRVLGQASRFGDAVMGAAGKGFRFARSRLHLVTVAVLVMAGLALFARTYWGRRFRIALPTWLWPRRHPRLVSRVGFYETLLRRLARLGVEKPISQTAAEFAGQWEDHLPGISELTALYYRVRFGGEILSAEDETRVARLSTAICLAAVGDTGRTG